MKGKVVCVVYPCCPCTITCCRDPFHFLDLNFIFLSLSFPIYEKTMMMTGWYFLCVSDRVDFLSESEKKKQLEKKG